MVEAFRWTTRNNFLAIATHHYLAMGGGTYAPSPLSVFHSNKKTRDRTGQFGLWLDETLSRGHSETCETFNNPPLATRAGPEFEINGVELWATDDVIVPKTAASQLRSFLTTASA